jgi:hypothetical protein
MRLGDQFGNDHAEVGHDDLICLIASDVTEMVAHPLYQDFPVVNLGVKAARIAVKEVKVGYFPADLLLCLSETIAEVKVKALDDLVLQSLILEKQGKEEILAAPSIGLLHKARNFLPPL